MRTALRLLAIGLGLICVPVGSAQGQGGTVAVAPAQDCAIELRTGPRCHEPQLRVANIEKKWQSCPDACFWVKGFVEQRSLLRFDLAAAVPPGARVESAQLTVTEKSGSGNANIAAHRITSPWTNDATWEHRASPFGDANEWARDGGDYAAASESRLSVSGGPAARTWDLTTLARGWHAGTIANHGVLLRLDPPPFDPVTERHTKVDRVFAAAEDSIAAARPVLRVSYSIDDTAPPDLELGGDLVDLAASPLTGEIYDLWVDASDGSGAGVRKIELHLNGAPVASVENDCFGPACGLDLDWDYLRDGHAPGHYNAVARATDWAGNSTTESLAFDLSADRTADPDLEEPAAPLAMSAEAPGCDVPEQLLGDRRTVSRASRQLGPQVQESTSAYADGSYLVTRCSPGGALVKAQHVRVVATPLGPAPRVLATTTPGTSAGEYVTATAHYGDPTDPQWAREWRLERAQLKRQVLPPTPGTVLEDEPQTLPGGSTEPGPESCARGAELKYNGHTFGESPWRYYVIRSTFPPEFDTPRARTRVMERFRDGVRTWNEGRNGCHYPALRDHFHTALAGTEGWDPDNHTDGESAVGFVNDLVCGDSTDAIACATSNNYDFTVLTTAGFMRHGREVDIRFAKDEPWHERRSRRNCALEYDLWAVAAHEVGHAAGHGDSDADTNKGQTMYHQSNFCRTHPRTLGRSDWIGLKRLYTYPD